MDSTFGGDEGRLEELSLEDLEYYRAEGIFSRIDNHKEHITLHPFWISKFKQGMLEEIRKSLGKWNSRLNGYVVGFENAVCSSPTAALNEDHKWLHLEVLASFYMYSPSQGQVLKGTLQKKGAQAGICTLFNVFSATVYPSDDTEMESWDIGEEIQFKVTSFTNRRKGPVIRAKSLGDGPPKKKKKKELVLEESWE